MFFDILIWIIALGILIKASDIFTNKAEKIWLAFWVSSFIIWLTVVSIWTSLPELVTSLMAIFGWQSNFPIDNILGSNVANSLLIVWLTAIIVGWLKVKDVLIDVDIPYLFIVTILFAYFIYSDSVLSLWEWIVFIVLLIWYFFYTLRSWEDIEEEAIEKKEKKKKIKLKSLDWGLLTVSTFFIFVWAKYTLASVENIAKWFEVSPSIITMIWVWLGTSLPELVVSITAALKWRHGIVIWNIFWSNIFNILMVWWFSSFVWTTSLSPEGFKIWLPFLIISLFAFIFSIFDNKVKSWEGFWLLVIYVVYLLKVVEII